MRTADRVKLWLVIFSMAAVAFGSLPALALDTNGRSTINDAACWVNPACSIPRGGNSDVMTVYLPGVAIGVRGRVFDQIFAFGGEEANNVYFFDVSRVQGDLNQMLNYTTLWNGDGSAWSDAFGVGTSLLAPGVFVGFISDPRLAANIPLTTFRVFEKAGFPNPAPQSNDTDRVYLTVNYDASKYLSPTMQGQGFTATFQSVTAVPELESYPMMLVGLLLVGAIARRRMSRS